MPSKPQAVTNHMRSVIKELHAGTLQEISSLEEKLAEHNQNKEDLEGAIKCVHAGAVLENNGEAHCPTCGFTWMSWEID